ncbi:hypothetical protein JTB14_012711 [Gonioctena quinquepunctata]|nr:hypothetical protein JTB14_012711 [Gonioctena quinquepunctata]
MEQDQLKHQIKQLKDNLGKVETIQPLIIIGIRAENNEIEELGNFLKFGSGENMEDISELDLKPKSHSEPGTPMSKRKNTIEKPPEEDNSTQLPSTQMNDKADTTLKEATTEWVTNFLTD